MEKMVQLIVEYEDGQNSRQLMNKMGIIKYHLPMIQSFVVEMPENKMPSLKDVKGIKSVETLTKVTAQMNNARKTVNAGEAKKQGLTGRGIGIAILDTGIAPKIDFVKPYNRIVAFKDFVNGRSYPYDENGHGTHVAGIAAGNGYESDGLYTGIAPEANIISVKILDRKGEGNSALTLAGLQWIMDHRKQYNIRIVNLSIGTEDASLQDPIIRGVNAAWDSNVVVTVAAGNNGPRPGTITSPGISKKVITVGAFGGYDEAERANDDSTHFSGRGPTMECVIKPDIIAPGVEIVSCLSPNCYQETVGSKEKNDVNIIDKNHLQMSGTSMSTPIVSGAIALLLQKYPYLTSNEVKLRIKECARKLQYPQNQQGWGLIDIQALLQ